MKISTTILTLALCALGSQAGATPTDAEKQAMLADALSAAPPTLRDSVTVVDWQQNVLQQGSGSYTCFPTPPQLEGTAPMCLDGPWMAWASAWMEKQPFQAEAMGISYMLAGDGGASNTDPYAEGQTADNQWIVEGPHLMIIVPDSSLLEALPTDPASGGPYVMWKNTPYAHIMVPVGARP